MSRWKLLLVGKNNKVESLLDKLAWRVNLPTLRFLPDGHPSNNYHFDDPPTVQLNLHHPCPARPFVRRRPATRRLVYLFLCRALLEQLRRKVWRRPSAA